MRRMGPLRFAHPPHLPPPSVAPIIEFYDVNLARLPDEYRLEAPVDDRGIVDLLRTVDLALELVDPSYQWPGDDCDEHHFVWERDLYLPKHWKNSTIPRDYREIPFHKGLLPRQFHDFLHAVIAPPPIPDFEVMRSRVESYKTARQLFESARLAVILGRKPEKFKGIDRLADGTYNIDQEVMLDILQAFEDRIQRERALIGANEFIDFDVGTMQPHELARKLGSLIAKNMNLKPQVRANRGLAVT